MSETKVVPLLKDRGFLIYMGGVEILALKLEGFKTIQIGGVLSPIGVGIEGQKAETSDWLALVKDKNQITMPYDVWAKQVAQEISKATGSSVNTISVVSSVPANATAGIGVRGSATVKEVEKK
jgi:hypothetical protein